MRILYFADIRFPLERANGIQTMETCHALAERGHRVALVVKRDTHDPPRDPFEFYGLAPPSGRHVSDDLPAEAGSHKAAEGGQVTSSSNTPTRLPEPGSCRGLGTCRSRSDARWARRARTSS